MVALVDVDVACFGEMKFIPKFFFSVKKICNKQHLGEEAAENCSKKSRAKRKIASFLFAKRGAKFEEQLFNSLASRETYIISKNYFEKR